MPRDPDAAPIAGNSAARTARIEKLRTELVHLDAVLRMFRPNFKAEGLPVRHRRPTKSPYFAHGELTKRIYDAIDPADRLGADQHECFRQLRQTWFLRQAFDHLA